MCILRNALVVAAFITSVPGCDDNAAAVAPEAAPPFVVAAPEVKDTAITKKYVAEIRAVRHAELRSRFKGVLETVAADEGQAVKAGQTLFAVNARALKQEVLVSRAALLGVQAELEAAQLELQNTKLLQAKNVVSGAQLAIAESKVQTLRAKLEEAKATVERASVELGFAEIRAPFDGLINRVPKRTGSAIGEDELLTTITDNREVFAYFRITEREYLDFVASTGGQAPREVTLELADGRAFPGDGTIDAVASEFDRETGTLTYRARFQNPTGTLKHGASGKVVIATHLPGAMVIPQSATFDVQGHLHVFVVDTGNVTRARKISVKARVGDLFVVDQGLERNERFVLEGVQKVKDGMRIEVAAPTAVAPAAAVQGG